MLIGLDPDCPSAWPLSCLWEQCIPASRRGPYNGIKYRLLTHKEAWKRNENR